MRNTWAQAASTVRSLAAHVRKSDGGFGYGATDLAAVRLRTTDLGATRLLYVVGLPQRQHFETQVATDNECPEHRCRLGERQQPGDA